MASRKTPLKISENDQRAEKLNVDNILPYIRYGRNYIKTICEHMNIEHTVEAVSHPGTLRLERKNLKRVITPDKPPKR